MDRSLGIGYLRGPAADYIDLIEHGEGAGITKTLAYLAEECERGRRPNAEDLELFPTQGAEDPSGNVDSGRHSA